MRITAKALAFIASLLPFAALGQSAPANLGYHTLYGRIGAVPGDTGPGQAIPWSTILSKGILDGVGTAQGTIPCRGASVWGPLTPGAAGTLLASGGTTVCPGWIPTVPVANGGTGNATAPGARSSTGLNIDQFTGHNDSNYTILATDRTVGTNTALTAPRIWTLPAANSVNPGQTITVADYALGVSATNTLTVAAGGSDAIVTTSSVTSIALNAAGARLDFRSDGVSKWSTSGSSTASSGLQTKSPLDYGAACDGTTDDSTAIAAWLVGISNNAFVGWGLNGKTCRWKGLIPISSGTTLYLNQMTLKLLDSVTGANNAFVCGPTTELGGPITGLTIRDGVIDGNRANQTNTEGNSALLYCPSVNNLYVENTYFINGRADGINVSGTSNAGGQGKSHNVILAGVHTLNNYRNGLTIDGVDEMTVLGGFFDSTTNTNNDGPQCGIDAEPDDSNGTNTNVTLIGISGSSNGNASFSGSGGSAACVFGTNTNTSNLTIWGPKGNSNKNYVVDTFSSATPAQVRLFGAGGTSNGVGVYHSANIVDWLPTTIVKGAASSCGTGFACIGVPN